MRQRWRLLAVHAACGQSGDQTASWCLSPHRCRQMGCPDKPAEPQLITCVLNPSCALNLDSAESGRRSLYDLAPAPALCDKGRRGLKGPRPLKPAHVRDKDGTRPSGMRRPIGVHPPAHHGSCCAAAAEGAPMLTVTLASGQPAGEKDARPTPSSASRTRPARHRGQQPSWRRAPAAARTPAETRQHGNRRRGNGCNDRRRAALTTMRTASTTARTMAGFCAPMLRTVRHRNCGLDTPAWRGTNSLTMQRRLRGESGRSYSPHHAARRGWGPHRCPKSSGRPGRLTTDHDGEPVGQNGDGRSNMSTPMRCPS